MVAQIQTDGQLKQLEVFASMMRSVLAASQGQDVIEAEKAEREREHERERERELDRSRKLEREFDRETERRRELARSGGDRSGGEKEAI